MREIMMVYDYRFQDEDANPFFIPKCVR